MLNAFGTLTAPTTAAALTPAQRDTATISAAQPPGLYGTGDGAIALNLGPHIPPPVAARLPGAQPLGDATPPQRLGPDLIAGAMLLLALDLLISLALRGAFSRRRFGFLFCSAPAACPASRRPRMRKMPRCRPSSAISSRTIRPPTNSPPTRSPLFRPRSPPIPP